MRVSRSQVAAAAALALLGLVAVARLGSVSVGSSATLLLAKSGRDAGSRVSAAETTMGLEKQMSTTIAGEELAHIDSVSNEVLSTDPDASIRFGASPKTAPSLAVRKQQRLEKEVANDRKENKKLATPTDADDVLGAINSLPASPKRTTAAPIVGTKPAVASKARMDKQAATSPTPVKLVALPSKNKAVNKASKPTAAAKAGLQPILFEEEPQYDDEEEAAPGDGEMDFIQPKGEEPEDEKGPAFEPMAEEGPEEVPEWAVEESPLGDEVFDLGSHTGGADNGDVHVPGGAIKGYTFRQVVGGPHGQQLSDEVPFLGEGPWVKVPVEGEMSGAGVGANKDGSNGIPVDRWFDESAIVGGKETSGLGDGSPLGGGMDRMKPAGELPSVYGRTGPTNAFFRASVAQQLHMQHRGVAAAARAQRLHEEVPRKLSCIGGPKGVCGDEVISPYTDKREGDVGLPAANVQPYFYARGGGRRQQLAQTTGTFEQGANGGKSPRAEALLRDLGRDMSSADQLVMKAAQVTSPGGLWKSVWANGGKAKMMSGVAGQKLSGGASMGDAHNRDNVKCVGKVCGDETLDHLGNVHVKNGEVFKKGWSGWDFFNKDAKGAQMLARRHTYEDGGRLHRGESDTDSASEMARFYDRQPSQ